MKNLMQYKNYFTKIEFDPENKVLYGKIEGINDLVNFESESTEQIENEFHKAVDDYLELCAELGTDPDKVYRGSFNVRISPQLHRAIALEAMNNDESLNSFVEKALDTYINNSLSKKLDDIWSAVSNNQYSIQPKSSAYSRFNYLINQTNRKLVYNA